MCGIAGLIGIGNSEILEKMTAILAHRGPDDSGVQWFPHHSSGLGHRRLSIIDLSPGGHQPMPNDDESLWITFNGELYNYREIRQELHGSGVTFKTESDTEVILKSYQTWGIRCLEKFNGMFAFAIFDTRSGELFAARDRIGIKPFYYTSQKDGFIFASEIKAILQGGLVEKEPDYFALHTPTRFQISPLTGFKNIFKLPPAHYLSFKNGQLSVRQYWQVEPVETSISEEDAIAQLEERLFKAIQLQMVADVEVGAFLSGGLDSSLITVLMAKQTNKNIKTFTIKFSDEDQKLEMVSDDSYYAQKVAGAFGFRHREFEIRPDIVDLLPKMVWHIDEPLADAAAINLYLMSKTARESGIIVLLNGMGGDEIYGGYRKQLACLKAEVYQQYFPGIIRRFIEGIVDKIPIASAIGASRRIRWGKRFLYFASLPQTERFLSADMSMSPGEYHQMFINGDSYYDTHFYKSQAGNFNSNGLSYLTRMCLNDTRVFLPEHNLTYSDKATMAASIESRPPLTDHELVEFMFTLPPQLRIRGNQQKYLLKKVAERHLPKEIIYREKGSFGSPIRPWIRGPLREMVDDHLSFQSLQQRGLYNPEYVRAKIAADRQGKEDNAYLVWQLLTTELWFRTFFE